MLEEIDNNPTVVSSSMHPSDSANSAGRRGLAATPFDAQIAGIRKGYNSGVDDDYDPQASEATFVTGGHTVILTPVAELASAAFLYCRKGLRRGQLVKLTSQRSEFGRAADCAVPIEDAAASSHHGAILLEDSAWKIFDFASSNGTFVNGERLGTSAANPSPLKDGDSIIVGETEYVFKQID